LYHLTRNGFTKVHAIGLYAFRGKKKSMHNYSDLHYNVHS
jgi:hypothetical protein